MQKEIKARLEEFQNLSEKQKYQEFLFCLLTPQSKAQSCWQAVLELSRLTKKEWTLPKIKSIIKTKTRFHNTKAKRVFKAKETYKTIKPLLEDESLSIPYKRAVLSKTVNGYGLKEASHFLRNIGLSQNKIAILDRHILKNLRVSKIKSQKHYLQTERLFLRYARLLNKKPDVLDLQLWSKENGEIFK
ncbi:DNA lyase [Candidatus Pacearchaeota archaeon]|nr:DNA lyase [Candidatus Pacearchaeota archaeon]|tara:strand:- start:3707 stop:4270 length:564 start_codon:yes stop_codon:yes gene_type:complete